MPLSRPQKFRPVLIAAVVAVVVGSTGAAFAATHTGGGSTGPAANTLRLESRPSATTGPTTGTPTPTGAATTPTAKQRKHHPKRPPGRKHSHAKPTARPTTSASPTSAAPTTAAPTTAPATPGPGRVTPSHGPATQPAKPSATTTAPAGGTATTQTAKFQAQVLALTNAERAQAGCKVPLKANAALTKAAQAHAEDMLKHNYFDHNSQNGTDPFKRITAAGYTWSGAAENIAAGDPTPEAVMHWWMHSAGHKANILNCGLKDLGVGYAAGSGATFGQYWVQDFGSPLS